MADHKIEMRAYYKKIIRINKHYSLITVNIHDLNSVLKRHRLKELI